MSNPYTLVGSQQTEGTWLHTGRLIVTTRLDDGKTVTVTLPDDLQTLLARVAALEARAIRAPA